MPKSRLPVRDLGADAAGVDAPHVDVDARAALVEGGDERQQAVDRAVVGADEHPAALEVASSRTAVPASSARRRRRSA